MMTFADRSELEKAANRLPYDASAEARRKVEAARNEKWKALCRAIAEHLGAPWEAVDKTDGDGKFWRCALANPETEGSLYTNLSPYHAKGRLTISGDFPHGKRGTYKPCRESFDITVNEDRPPEEIARDIKRRLLPKYELALAAAYLHKANDEGRAARRLFRYATLTTALGEGELVNKDADYPEIRCYRRHGEEGGHALSHMEAKSWHGDRYDVKLEMNYELTLKVFEFIRKYEADGGGQLSL